MRRATKHFIRAVLTVLLLIIAAVVWFSFNMDTKVPDEQQSYDVPNGVAEFHFIDVGQGDATLIKTGNKNVLIDTGKKSAKDELLNYLNSHGVTEIEYFVITHFDSDHMDNGVDILDNYDVKNLIVPDQSKTNKTIERFLDKVEEQVTSKDIDVLNANEMIGERLEVEQLELTVLAPLRNDYDDSNDYSVTMMVRFGNKRVLLSGDAEKEAEEDIVSKYSTSDLNCDVYKLGHHGSSTSSSQELLDLATPEYVIVSCGLGNEYGHPHIETMERVKDLKIYRTDTQGSIVLKVANDEITVKTEK